MHAVDAARCAAEKEASVWQQQMHLGEAQHQKQMAAAKSRCQALQAERDALTMALSAVATELVRPKQPEFSEPSVTDLCYSVAEKKRVCNFLDLVTELSKLGYSRQRVLWTVWFGLLLG